MRKDFDKVIVENGRGGFDGHHRRGRRNESWRRDPDNVPRQLSLRRDTYKTKHLSERLGPLRRFLRAQIGRRWDDVYSEIRKTIPANDPVRDHVMNHAWSYVKTDVVMVDGLPYEHDRSRWALEHFNGLRPIEKGHHRDLQLYVDPDTGLLCEAPSYQARRARERAKAWKRVDVGTTMCLCRKDGVWHEVQLDRVRVLVNGDSRRGYFYAYQKDALLGLDPNDPANDEALWKAYGEDRQDFSGPALTDWEWALLPHHERTATGNRYRGARLFAVSARPLTASEVARRIPKEQR